MSKAEQMKAARVERATYLRYLREWSYANLPLLDWHRRTPTPKPTIFDYLNRGRCEDGYVYCYQNRIALHLFDGRWMSFSDEQLLYKFDLDDPSMDSHDTDIQRTNHSILVTLRFK